MWSRSSEEDGMTGETGGRVIAILPESVLCGLLNARLRKDRKKFDGAIMLPLSLKRYLSRLRFIQ